MDNQRYKTIILEALKEDGRLWNKEKTEFNQRLLFEFVDKIDETVINLLLQKEETREIFFVKVKDVYVFKTNEFKFFMEENTINNSYTNYINQIGLSDGTDLIKNKKEVVLNFPFKDCVLEGGQTTEEGIDIYFEYDKKVTKTQEKQGYKDQSYNEKQSKRKEIFFNQILAKDEIDRLIDDKAFVNWKRYTKDGEQNVVEINRDETGLIKENLIIKGNNLLALHSLKKQFLGEIKLIYIDPPYNTGNDEFKYNDNFNHSTWLTFMKNRLEVANELLKSDGVILVQCDHHEVGYLTVLMDEVFKPYNKVQIIACKTASPAGFKTVNPGPIDVTEYILYYAKNKASVNFKKAYTPVEYDSNYNLFIENVDEKSDSWAIRPIIDKFYEVHGINGNKDAKEKWGKNWKKIRDVLMGDFALENSKNVASKRDPHNPTQKVKELMDKSKNIEHVIEVERESNPLFIYKGGSLAFYSNKLKEIEGILTPTELLTDFWSDISWAGIANEGGVKLKNGKKPEKLLHRIIDMTTEKNDIVLDYHLGSGTTAAVAHKMRRQYIGIEQMDYIESLVVNRLDNVIKGDQTGVSKSAKWQGGGDFIYCELAKWNEQAKEEIYNCKDLKELVSFFDVLCQKYFLNYNVKINEFKNKVIYEKEFIDLSIEEQKRMFLSMLDLNQMYVQKTEMSDKKFGISKEDQESTKLFYGGE